MSDDPSQGMPPRQERWPQATPAEGWPPYRDGEGERADRQGTRGQRAAGSHRRPSGPPSAVATAALPAAGRAYGTTDSYGTDSYGTDDYRASAYRGTRHGYDRAGNDHGRAAGGYAGTGDGFNGVPDGYPGGAYLGPGSYTETAHSGPGYSDSGYYDPGQFDPGYSGTGYTASGYPDSGYFESEYSEPGLTAPDAGVDPDGWQEEQARRRAANHRGRLVSAATEFLATAVVIGVSTLAAGLLRAPVSPVGAMGTVFIDRMPAMLRGFAAHHFGTHGQVVLLLGMYAVIAVAAIAIGVAARRAAAAGVTGVAAFALIAGFVAVTRPAGRVTDVMPAVIGGLAGVAALLWLVRASAPASGLEEVEPLRPARGGTRRRTR